MTALHSRHGSSSKLSHSWVPRPAHWAEPTAHSLTQRSRHSPPEHVRPPRHALTTPHSRHGSSSWSPHVWKPLPEHCRWLWAPHSLTHSSAHSPPEQLSPASHGTPSPHSRQSSASKSPHDCTPSPAHCAPPAAHSLTHAARQLPPEQAWPSSHGISGPHSRHSSPSKSPHAWVPLPLHWRLPSGLHSLRQVFAHCPLVQTSPSSQGTTALHSRQASPSKFPQRSYPSRRQRRLSASHSSTHCAMGRHVSWEHVSPSAQLTMGDQCRQSSTSLVTQRTKPGPLQRWSSSSPHSSTHWSGRRHALPEQRSPAGHRASRPHSRHGSSSALASQRSTPPPGPHLTLPGSQSLMQFAHRPETHDHPRSQGVTSVHSRQPSPSRSRHSRKPLVRHSASPAASHLSTHSPPPPPAPRSRRPPPLPLVWVQAASARTVATVRKVRTSSPRKIAGKIRNAPDPRQRRSPSTVSRGRA